MAEDRGLAWTVRRLIRRLGYDLVRRRPPLGGLPPSDPLPDPFASLPFAGRALHEFVRRGGSDFETVLDVGCGAGLHARVLASLGKRVTALDYGRSPYFEDWQAPDAASTTGSVDLVLGDFNDIELPQAPFDAVWASHVLEHQLDVHRFLTRIHAVLREGGWLAVTVPPAKSEIVGGHVSLWNAGLLLYRLVLAGFDCRTAAAARYGYNVSVVVAKRSIELPRLSFDTGDVERLLPFLPPGLAEPFEGDIERLQW
jgi:SAM-dependent methyltransferase